jgi:O-antigen ligase
VTEAIVLIPALLAWWIASKQSLAAAFLQVYLPVFLIFPDYYSMPIPGLPDPSFVQATILPIGVGLCWKAFVKREWKYSPLDLALVLFLVWQVVCEVYNTGYEKMPDLIFDLITLAIFPYMAAKTLIEQSGLRAAFARRFVWALFLVCLLSIYEFRMGVSLFRPALGPFFPGQTPRWVTQLRWGFGRIAGPYGHAITMAVFIGVAYLLHRWLSYVGQWQEKFRWLGSHPFTKQQIIAFGLFAGLFMTLSRGPWLGAIAGGILALVGRSEQRRRALIRALLVLIVGGTILYFAGKAYLAGTSAFEGVEEQASAEYRAILIDQYEEIVMRSPVFGWGRANWPLVQGMLSIDNNYLFIALGTGLVGLGLFSAGFLLAIWRIFASGFFTEGLPREERTFRFALMGILISIAISTATTYLSAHLYPLYFIFLGWSETCVMSRRMVASAMPAAEPVASGYPMMRVIA